VPARSRFSLETPLPRQGSTIHLLPPNPAGKPISFQLRNGEHYTVREEGKGYRIEKNADTPEAKGLSSVAKGGPPVQPTKNKESKSPLSPNDKAEPLPEGGKAPPALVALRVGILDLINKHRAEKKAPALKVNSILQKVAQNHAENMARQEKSGHFLDGKGPVERAADADYVGAIGEIVTPAPRAEANSPVGIWMNSPSHRKNLLNPNYAETGIGAARSKAGTWYYCQMFGARKDGPPVELWNRAGMTITVATSKDGPPSVVPSGDGLKVHALASTGKVTLYIAAADGSGQITAEFRNGERYAVTKDGKGLKVEKLK
jgi:uncharacterized protein YkwD